MDTEKIKSLIEKIPLGPTLLFFALYLGYSHYDFTTSDTSPLIQKENELQVARGEAAELEKKVKIVKEFAKNLEAKKAEIRNMTQDLDSMKTSISETLDIPDFMKSTLTEARKVGLSVVSLRPTKNETKEYYDEQAFDLAFRGAFVQLVVFLDRLANMQKVVRVDHLKVAPLGSQTARFVELEGVIEVKTYRYRGSDADKAAKNPGQNRSGGTS